MCKVGFSIVIFGFSGITVLPEAGGEPFGVCHSAAWLGAPEFCHSESIREGVEKPSSFFNTTTWKAKESPIFKAA